MVSYTVEQFSNPDYRSKDRHPYSYDPILIYSKGKGTSTVYTDHMMRSDFSKFDTLLQDVFSSRSQQSWSEYEPAKIEQFLRRWFDKPSLQLNRVEEHCNQATGFPVWRFDYT